MRTSEQWLGIDITGIRAQVAGRPKSFIIRELVQNAWDEKGVTEVRVTLEPIPGKSKAKLIVEDDSTEGYYDLRHAYTVFAHTRKCSDPTMRGRFNIGEKQVLSLCDEATILTTKGEVTFRRDGKRVINSKKCTESGSIFSAIISMSRKEIEEIENAVETFLPPVEIKTFFNGELIEPRSGEDFEVKLQTEYADEDGVMRLTSRITRVEVIEPNAEETPMLYEMGLPVCETGDRWHYNVSQRVPLTIDRDNVKAAYLRDLRAEVLNVMHRDLTEEEVAEPWVQDAMADDRVEAEAVRSVVVKQHGQKSFVPTPGDPRANERAVAMGYTAISGSSYGKGTWDNIRSADALKSSVQIAGSTASVSCEHIDTIDWTEDMVRVARLTEFIAKIGLGITVNVRMIKSPHSTDEADYGNQTVRFNASHLKRAWFRPDNLKKQIDLIIHEVGHEGGGHLEMGYHEALTKIAAAVALTDPQEFRDV